ncbi:MAG: UDP-N-acetylmuramoyl-L-alanine--D-glutamate ligase [Actinomycetota bacterium]|nr:UDP-N-acetylmuramoyl-L-alanine--D-glutamate ligase [Actinomycetota bacterium]
MSFPKGSVALVVGLGISGVAAARALKGAGAEVRVTDGSDHDGLRARAAELKELGIEVELGGHATSIQDVDVAVVSPGIPLETGIVTSLVAAGVETISEIELGYRLARCDILAVTGTNGKTTTTELLAAMLDNTGVVSMAAGNIGTPLTEAVASIGEGGAIATEVSSFQLALTKDFRPRVAVVLNVAEDHTDWHGDAAAYGSAKGLITKNQGSADTLVFNREDAISNDIAAHTVARTVPFSAVTAPKNGIGVVHGEVRWRGEPLMDSAELSLPGRAGADDSLAAAAAALSYGCRPDAVVQAARDFLPLSHRLETVATVSGVTFIDDSKATNPHATLAALEGLNDVVLIAGGRSKGIDLRVLKAAVPSVVAVVALGEASDEIVSVFQSLVPVEKVGSMGAAVRRAFQAAGGRGSVLLSPSCASLDMYSSYAARGDDFKRAVARLETGRMPSG